MKQSMGFRPGLAALALLVALFGCDSREAPAGSAGRTEPQASSNEEPRSEASGASQEEVPEASEERVGRSYIDTVAAEVAAGIRGPGMGEYERAKAAFDYMIASTSLAEPVGLDLWRIRGAAGQLQPSYVENRSLSVLLYGIGMCEDYAAAFTLLLRELGLEAEYVPGLTYSAEGPLVDHAWVVAKVDGIWYHLDCQLEDNISRHGAIRYRYFMKGDGTMAGSHRWGQNLINAGLLTNAQNAELAESYLMPDCPQDYPAPARQEFTAAPAPDRDAIQAEIAAEFNAYENIHGPLEPLELDIIPPVFALEGYGPPG